MCSSLIYACINSILLGYFIGEDKEDLTDGEIGFTYLCISLFGFFFLVQELLILSYKKLKNWKNKK